MTVQLMKDADLPWSVSTEPILARKVADLRFMRNHVTGEINRVAIESRYMDGHQYAMDARASCRYHLHQAPALHCSCGFYAYARWAPVDFVTTGSVILDVELSGRVIVHETGYRAERQRIIAVHLVQPTYAKFCRKEGCLSRGTSARFKDGRITWACAQHGEQLDLAWLSELVGVPVIDDTATVATTASKQRRRVALRFLRPLSIPAAYWLGWIIGHTT